MSLQVRSRKAVDDAGNSTQILEATPIAVEKNLDGKSVELMRPTDFFTEDWSEQLTAVGDGWYCGIRTGRRFKVIG